MHYRNVWKIYLDQEQFQLARKYAEVRVQAVVFWLADLSAPILVQGNQASMDLILVRQAEHHFKEGQWV